MPLAAEGASPAFARGAKPGGALPRSKRTGRALRRLAESPPAPMVSLSRPRAAGRREQGPPQFWRSTRRATAWAAMPSPVPVKPRPSSVVAFTLTFVTEIPRSAAIFVRMASI